MLQHRSGEAHGSNLSLSVLDDIRSGEEIRLHAEELMALQAMIQEQEEIIKAQKATIQAILEELYLDGAKSQLGAKGQDTGTTHVIEGEVDVSINIPKKVTWDQDALAVAEGTVSSWGENPTEYMTIERKVSETAYKAWPTAIKKVFMPARTMKPGKPKFELKKKAS